MYENKLKELKRELRTILFALEVNKSTKKEITDFKNRRKEIELEIKQILYNQLLEEKEGRKI